MKRKTTYSLAFALCAMALLLLSACGPATSSTAQSNLTPLQVLQKSADAMKKVSSTHIEMQSQDSVQTTGAAVTSTREQQGTPVPTNVNVSLKASGQQSGTDQQLDVTVNALNQPFTFSELTKGDKVYVKNAQGKWYVLNKSDYTGTTASNPFSGLNLDQQTLLGIIQEIKVTDNGTQSLNGQSLRHITADLDKTALKKLLDQNPDLKSQFGQQNIDTVLNSTKSFQSSVDVWIDETNFYVHRTELKINLTADTSAATNTSSSVTTNLDVIVDLSKFNEPVTITAPADATPLTNPSAIFGGGQQP